MAKEYTPLNLPKSLVEELKVWKMAFEMAYADPSFSYERMIRCMLNSLQDTNHEVVEELDVMVEKRPELAIKLEKYNRERDDE